MVENGDKERIRQLEGRAKHDEDKLALHVDKCTETRVNLAGRLATLEAALVSLREEITSLRGDFKRASAAKQRGKALIAVELIGVVGAIIVALLALIR